MLTKPRIGTRLNLAHPLASGLDLALITDWDTDPLYGAGLTRTGSPTTGGGTFGTGLKLNTTSQYVRGYWPKRKYDARTIMVVADFATWGLYASPYVSSTNESLGYGNANPGFSWVIHGATWNTSHNPIPASIGWNPTLQNKKGAVVVASWNRLGDGFGRGYLNGKLAATGASAITTISDRTLSSASTAIDVGTPKTFSMNTYVLYALFHWARALSVAEIEDLSANPWLLFGSRGLFSLYNSSLSTPWPATTQILCGSL